MSSWDRRANEIFLEAIERPESDRGEFVASACNGDSGLRRLVESLLAAASKSRDFIEEPVVKRPSDRAFATSFELSPIEGRYRLEEKIGSGGMGVVYAAVQTTPIVRKVAVKLIRSDGDNPAQLARFEQERQALALMDHPNIAKVFDAGATFDGRPYFVMEFIDGSALTEYCDRTQRSIAARLDLFVSVCRGLHHAHQKGVIHRDLKPSNVLVCELEGTPTPKLIDFGVAKAIGSRLIERTIQTNQATLVGTLEYMAPEQAGLSGADGNDVDTRCDVYSMGVILYELLTSLRPFEGDRLKKASLDEAVRIVRDEEPLSLARRLADHPKSVEAAANRRTDPKSLLAALSGDLNWIVLRCLAKDRERRYASANDLANDVRRYLANEPIEARPPSSIYRLQKLVQRRRGAALAALLVLLSLFGGTIGTTIGFFRAERARKAEAEVRADAESARDQAWDALDAMTSLVTGDSLASQPEVSAEQKQFLANAIGSYRQLAHGRANDERSQKRTALATRRVARIEGILGDSLQSANSYLAAAKSFSALAALFPDEREYRRMHAISLGPAGVAFGRAGLSNEAGKALQQAVDVLNALCIENPNDLTCRSDYGVCLLNFAVHCRDARRWDESAKLANEADALFDDLTREQPEEAHHWSNAAGCRNLLATLAQATNDLASAERQYRRAIEILETVREGRPSDPLSLHSISLYRRNLGRLLCQTGRRDDGVRLLRQSLEGFQQLAERFPSQPHHREETATSMIEVANAYFGRGMVNEQIKLQRSAVDLLERLVAEQTGARKPYVLLAGAQCNVANLLRGQGRFSDAIESYDKAVALLDARRSAGETSVQMKDYLEKALRGRGVSNQELKQWHAASKDYRRLAEFVDAESLVEMRLSAALCLAKAGQPTEASAELGRIGDDSKLSGYDCFVQARIEALISKAVPEQSRAFADRAVKSLERALCGGLKEPKSRLMHGDFELLRERDDFKKLHHDASAATPADKAPLG